MIEFDISWCQVLCSISCYILCYVAVGAGFRYNNDVKASAQEDNDHYKGDYYYFVPLGPWLEYWYFRVLLWKLNGIEYPRPKAKTIYVNYRELQFVVIIRAMALPFAIIDTALIICKIPNAYICMCIYALLIFVLHEIFYYPVLRHDIKRFKSYKYMIAMGDEGILSKARGNPPTTWKINNLLEVFFHLGEARIRYCKPRNYLVYKLKNDRLMYIFLKTSFETMPEPDLDPEEIKNLLGNLNNYNNAITIWVDEVIIVDGNPDEDDILAKLKDVKPQDMPENIC